MSNLSSATIMLHGVLRIAFNAGNWTEKTVYLFYLIPMTKFIIDFIPALNEPLIPFNMDYYLLWASDNW
jgi:hypothetical protein